MLRIRMPRACTASNNSLGGMAVLTAKKFAAEGTGWIAWLRDGGGLVNDCDVVG